MYLLFCSIDPDLCDGWAPQEDIQGSLFHCGSKGKRLTYLQILWLYVDLWPITIQLFSHRMHISIRLHATFQTPVHILLASSQNSGKCFMHAWRWQTVRPAYNSNLWAAISWRWSLYVGSVYRRVVSGHSNKLWSESFDLMQFGSSKGTCNSVSIEPVYHPPGKVLLLQLHHQHPDHPHSRNQSWGGHCWRATPHSGLSGHCHWYP